VNWQELTGDFYCVDVGSRGGFEDLRTLRPSLHVYSLDADPAAPLPSEEFASFHHFSLALHSSRGERDFFLTVVLNQLGYVSLALDFLRSASFPPDRIEALLRATARVEPEPRWKRALRSHLPPSVYRGLKRLNRRLRYRS